jgi:hypothetical protein
MNLDILLTTVITSTAALVAIIGGFLISRVISIASEQSGVKRKLREINKDVQTKKGLIENVKVYLFEDGLEEFVEDRDIIRGLLLGKSLENIIREEDFDTLSIEELRPYFYQLHEIKKEIYGNGGTLDGLREDKMKYPERKSWYKIIATILDELREEQRSFHPGSFTMPTFNPRFNSERPVKEKELGQLESELTILNAQKEEQERILHDYGKPRYVMSGLMVLAYAAVVGMIYPSTLLPYPQGVYDDVLTKWWILSLFFSHIVAIFFYLFVAMIRLGGTMED